MVVLVACAQHCCNGFFVSLAPCERIAALARQPERPEPALLRHQRRCPPPGRLAQGMLAAQALADAGMAQALLDAARAVPARAQVAGAHPGIGIIVDIALFHQPGDERGHVDRDCPAISILGQPALPDLA